MKINLKLLSYDSVENIKKIFLHMRSIGSTVHDVKQVYFFVVYYMIKIVF